MVGRRAFIYIICLLISLIAPPLRAQSGGTGAVTGTVTDDSRGAVASVKVTIINSAVGFSRSVTTDASGNYRLPSIPPGTYTVSFESAGFSTVTTLNVMVDVTETASVNAVMKVGQVQQTVEVTGGAELLQAETTTLGRVVDEKEVQGLPLTNRNYTQLLALSPGVASDLTDAGQLGRNTPDLFVNGARSTDNTFQMDGATVNNFGSGKAGDDLGYTGIPVPNPDAIQEFKIQTGLYDATYGRGAGANVNVVTKSGTNHFHGSVFEFFRNDALDANDYFLNQTGQPRPELRQNQFGGVIGGPIIKDRLFFFGSYQGTRQINGQGSSSLSDVDLPPLTSDRSAAALGALFCGQSGANGGVAVACDGSNINPVALKLLQSKLSNGQLFIPNPQTIGANGVGFGSFSVPSSWTEDQYLGNLDYVISQKNTLHGRYFFSRDPQIASFTTAGTVPGTGAESYFRNQVFTLSDTTILSSSMVNDARFTFLRNFGNLQTLTPLTDQDLGITPASDYAIMPIITVDGLFSMGGTFNDNFKTAVTSYLESDQVSIVRGKHSFRFGGEFERVGDNFDLKGPKRGELEFLSFPDFLLGMSASQNGTSSSNIYNSTGEGGLSDRQFRVNNGSAFVQDDYKPTSRLTLNLGLRWDIFGGATEKRGEMVNFWPSLATNSFADGDNYTGFVAANNFSGPLPNGVVRTGSNSFASVATPLKNLGPRVGLSWSPFTGKHQSVVRAGYGLYYTRTSGNDILQLAAQPPFIDNFRNVGINNKLATFQVPFNPGPPAPGAFPIWIPRTSTSQLTLENLDKNFRAPMVQQFSLNVEQQLSPTYMVQIGYVGSRGTRLLRYREVNEALLASADNPIHGVTTNTVENANQRVPVLGMAPNGLLQMETAGFSWYNSLQASLSKRMSKGFQFQVAYTFSKTLDDVPASTGADAVFGGFFSNSSNNIRQAWGPADFNRPQRLVISYLWNLPSLRSSNGILRTSLSGWSASGVTTFQSGHSMTILDSTGGTAYGASYFYWQTRGQLCPGATPAQVKTGGSVTSKLNNYFNAGAFCASPAIGDGTGFGNSSRGIVRSPDQRNFDFALSKDTPLKFSETANLEFRAESFNLFNTPQFGDPGNVLHFANFGQITSTNVAPRLLQFGLKLQF